MDARLNYHTSPLLGKFGQPAGDYQPGQWA